MFAVAKWEGNFVSVYVWGMKAWPWEEMCAAFSFQALSMISISGPTTTCSSAQVYSYTAQHLTFKLFSSASANLCHLLNSFFLNP